MAVVPEETGYPLKWFKHKDIARNLYECVICLEVVKDPLQVRDCGHLFCRYCLGKVLRQKKQCPSCRNEISEEIIFPDKNANRAIGKLDVNCPSTGCQWSGTLNSLLQEHTARCKFFLLDCSNVSCDIQVIRQEFEDHLKQCAHRTVVCEYCDSGHVFKEKAEHLEDCPYLPVECVNECSRENIRRNQMKEHFTVCPKTVIKCKYIEFGCEYQCKREKMEKHLNQETKEHLELSTLEISRMKKKHEKDIKELKEQIKELNYVVADKTVPTTPPIMIITNVTAKLSEAIDNKTWGTIDGEPFYTSPNGYKLKMTVQLNVRTADDEGFVGVYIHLMKSDHDAILSWPFKKKYTFSLIDQHDDEEERLDIVKTITPGDEDEFKRPKDKPNSAYGFPNFAWHAIFVARRYIKNDTVFITLSFEDF